MHKSPNPIPTAGSVLQEPSGADERVPGHQW